MQWKPGAAFGLVLSTAALLVTAVGCDRPTKPGATTATAASPADHPRGEWFEEIGATRGLHFVQECGAGGRYSLPEVIGSGAALFDYDNDGRLDVLLIQNGGPDSSARNKLFHQEPDGSFRDVSAGCGLDRSGRGMGVAIGDVNNDGLPDVVLTGYGGARLLINRGNGRFEDVTHDAGLDIPGWSVSASFCDFDRDGWLDLAVVRYVAYTESTRWTDVSGQPEYAPPLLFAGSSARVYRNLGRMGNVVRFEDVSFPCGIGRVAGPGLGIACADFDGDGWPDVLIANDGAANQLWINQRNFTFREEALSRGLALNANGVPQANMGVAMADLTGAGLFDVYITHLTEESNVLWRQGPAGFFEDRTAASWLASPLWRGTGFGAVFADFDNDGQADLAVVNGRVRRSRIDARTVAGDYWAPYRERNQIFRNQGGAQFGDISDVNPAFCSIPNVGRGLACGDIDNDGGIDLLVTALNAPARLYRNVAPRRGHWLVVRAIDPALGGRDAYGAHVMLKTDGSERHGWVNPGYSYASSNDPRVHFGLGDAARFDSIDMIWPDGLRERFDGGAADRLVVLARGTGRRQSPATRSTVN
ncbi:MAG TPA: CRTAC1 family protein [Tepidisphaeraceae bacterium]